MSDVVLTSYRIRWLLTKIEADSRIVALLSKKDSIFLDRVERSLEVHGDELILRGDQAKYLEKLAA